MAVQNVKNAFTPNPQFGSKHKLWTLRPALMYWTLKFIRNSERPPDASDISVAAFDRGIYLPIDNAFKHRKGCSWGSRVTYILARWGLINRSLVHIGKAHRWSFICTLASNGKRWLQDYEKKTIEEKNNDILALHTRRTKTRYRHARSISRSDRATARRSTIIT